jgi:hypothetical protein
MALDFPNAPTVGQVYQGYVWDGVAWQVQGTPTAPVVNDRRNGFRNASFDVWQRGVSPAAAAIGNYGYTADGWMVAFAGANGTIGRASNARSGARSLYAMQLTGATSCSGAVLKQRIESTMAAPLAGKTVTVQAQITNNTGASITPGITINRPNAQDNWSGSTNELSYQNLQACPNGATTQVSYTTTLSANAVNGLEVIFDFGGSLSSNAKTLVIAECDIQVTAGVANGLNASPPLATLRNPVEELSIAYRYYWRLNSSGLTTNYIFMAQCYTTGGAWGTLGLLPMPMRAVPTCTISAQNHLSSTNAGGSPVNFTSVTFGANSVSQQVIGPNNMLGASGLVAGNATIVNFNNASAWIDASAEL